MAKNISGKEKYTEPIYSLVFQLLLWTCVQGVKKHKHRRRIKRRGKEGSEEEEKKLPTQPVISKTAKNILGWLHIPLFY